MAEHTVFLPLAQLNTTVGGPAGTGPAAPATVAPVAGAATATGGAAAPAVPGTTAPGTTSAPGTNPAPPPPPPQAPGFGPPQILLIVVMFGALYFFFFRGPRKEEKKRKAMINELKKGDKVMTIGGMVARVISIEGDEVVLKVDESNNTKATYRKSAIQDVLDRDEKK